MTEKAPQIAIIREIEAQLIQLDKLLHAEVLISVYVKLLSEKRQLQELLKIEKDAE